MPAVTATCLTAACCYTCTAETGDGMGLRPGHSPATISLPVLYMHCTRCARLKRALRLLFTRAFAGGRISLPHRTHFAATAPFFVGLPATPCITAQLHIPLPLLPLRPGASYGRHTRHLTYQHPIPLLHLMHSPISWLSERTCLPKMDCLWKRKEEKRRDQYKNQKAAASVSCNTAIQYSWTLLKKWKKDMFYSGPAHSVPTPHC